MHGTRRLGVVFAIGGILSACMDAGDRGLGPACEAGLAEAERELSAAKANSIGKAIDWARAASLIAAARTQQQFNEYQNCVLKTKTARRLVTRNK